MTTPIERLKKLVEEAALPEVIDGEPWESRRVRVIAWAQSRPALWALAPALGEAAVLAEAAAYALDILEGFGNLRPISMTEPYPPSDYDEWRILRKDVAHVSVPALRAALAAFIAAISDEGEQ